MDGTELKLTIESLADWTGLDWTGRDGTGRDGTGLDWTEHPKDPRRIQTESNELMVNTEH